MRVVKRTGLLMLIVMLMFISGTSMLFAKGTQEKQGAGGKKEAAAGKQVVNYWSRNGAPLGTVMGNMIKEFNKANPDVQVKMQIMTWGGEYYSKIRSSIMVGKAPEIFDVAVYAPAMFLKYVESYTADDLKQVGINTSDYLETTWKALNFGGKYYGIPIGVFPIGLFYNKDLFQKAGLDPAKPPTNRTEFIEYGKKLTQDTDGDGKIDQWGTMEVDWYNLVGWIWESFMVQNGGSLLNKDNTKATFDSKEGVEALDLYVDFIRKYKISPPPGNVPAAFASQKIAMSIDFIHGLSGFKGKVNFGVNRMPSFFNKRPHMSWSSMNIFLSPKGLRKDAGKWQATMKFVKWVMGTDFQKRFALEAGEMPSRLSAFDALKTDPLLGDIAGTLASSQIFFPPSIKDATQMFSIIADAMGQAFAGKGSSEKILADAAKRVDQVLAAQ